MSVGFNDNTGTRWQVHLDLAAAKRMERMDWSEVYRGEVSFLEPDQDLFAALLDRTALQCAVIWELVREQAEQAGLTEEQFARRIDGSCLLQAKRALWDAVIDFFPSLRTSLSALFRAQEQATIKVDAALAAAAERLDRAGEERIALAIAAIERELGSTT